MELDEVDIGILESLQEDSRISFNEIANKLGVSLPTIRSRVEKMLELGVISSFTAKIDRSSLPELTIAFLLLTVKPADINNIIKQLKDIKEVKKIFQIVNNQLLIEVVAADISQFKTFMSQNIRQLKEIEKIDTFLVSDIAKEDLKIDLKYPSLISLRCVYCKNPIKGEPFIFEVENKKYYLCCPVCKQKFKEKISKLLKKSKA